MTSRICVFGNLTIDDIVFLQTCQLYPGVIGGNALFAAIGASAWQPFPALAARIGTTFPAGVLQKLDAAQILAYLLPVPESDIHNWILYEADGGRQIVTQLNSGSHNALSLRGDEIPAGCLGAEGYHIASMPTDVQKTIIDRLGPGGAILAWDPHLDYLRQPGLIRLAYEMLEQIHLFLPSRGEVMALTGEADLLAAGSGLAQHCAGTLIVKMGIEGSLVYGKPGGINYHVPAYPCRAVDPTGAGDAYCGGLLAAYLDSHDPVLAACCGTVSASFVVEKVGALEALPIDSQEAHKRLEYVKNHIRRISP